MSWKGFQKSVVRAPQQFRQKMHRGNITKDAVFLDTERRFEAIEEQTKRLHTESKRYCDAITHLLEHQVGFANAIEQVYQPISGHVFHTQPPETEGNPQGLAACQQFRDQVTELQQLIKPELDMIESRILKPADELLTITSSIKKMLTKRGHKQLDLDRHATSLQKLQEKKDRTVKEEEKMYKVENDYEIAQEEYNYYNDLLKDELPKLFALEAQFIKPLFQSFYFMQLNIFYTLFMHMEEMKIPYFDMQSGIMESYLHRRGNIQDRVEGLPITHFRVGHAKAKLQATKQRHNRGSAGPYTPDSDSPGMHGDAPPSYPGDSSYDYDDYSPHEYAAGSVSPEASPPAPARRTAGASGGSGYTGEKQTYQRPPATSGSAQEYCTALYDYEAQAEGDLSFRAGDLIEIVLRSHDPSDWWTGKLHGQQGIFPGNYVQLD